MKKILIISPADPYPVLSGLEECIWQRCVTNAKFAKVYVIFPKERSLNIPYSYENIYRIPYKTRLSSFLYKKTKPSTLGRAIYQTQFMNIMSIRNLIKIINPDIIEIHSPYIFPLLYLFIKNKLNSLTAQNLEYKLYKNKKLSILLYWWEILSFRLANKIFFVSYDESIHIKNKIKRDKVYWIPVPVNDEFGKKIRKKRANINRKKPYVIFLGSLNFEPNYEAVETIINQIMPRVLKVNPNVSFKIIGRYEKIPSNSYKKKNLEFLGFVDDLTDIFLKASVAIAPISSGAGVKIKVLNFLNAGIPTVISKIGAEGLRLKNKYHSFITDNWEKFSEYIILLIENQELANKVVSKATELINSIYLVQSISKRIKRIYDI